MSLPHQIDKPLAFLAFRLAGIDVQIVKRIEVSGSAGSHHGVRVIEREKPCEGYSWEAEGILWDKSKILTGRRWFYRNYCATQ